MKVFIHTSAATNPDLLSPYHHGHEKGEGTSLAAITQSKEKDILRVLCSVTMLVTNSSLLSVTGELVPQSLLKPHPQELCHV